MPFLACLIAAALGLLPIAAVLAVLPAPASRHVGIDESADNLAQEWDGNPPIVHTQVPEEKPWVDEAAPAEPDDAYPDEGPGEDSGSSGHFFYRDLSDGPAAPGSGQGREEPCEVGLDDVPAPPRFEDYPARPTVSRPAQPIIDNPLSSEYRTEISEAAAGGPDLAGDFALAQWGCGTACSLWALIDLRTGRVHIPPREIRMLFGPTHVRDAGLHFRPDSRLLIFAGMSHALAGPSDSLDEWYETISYLEVTPDGLRPVRVVSVADICPEGTSSGPMLERSPYSRKPR